MRIKHQKRKQIEVIIIIIHPHKPIQIDTQIHKQIDQQIDEQIDEQMDQLLQIKN